MARRKRKRNRKVVRVWVVVAIALLIAGFLARRMMMPRAMHYLTYRSPGAPQPIVPGSPDLPAERDAPAARQVQQVAAPNKVAPNREALATPAVQATAAAGAEHLTASDRRALDEILKRKSK